MRETSVPWSRFSWWSSFYLIGKTCTIDQHKVKRKFVDEGGNVEEYVPMECRDDERVTPRGPHWMKNNSKLLGGWLEHKAKEAVYSDPASERETYMRMPLHHHFL
ncbi:hypothetical protein KSZ_62030 [Dictyobacter formicarum]|uniref:Uncharacterized protein n=1 Tax=Dictyobacter formicarum TaxID=2778368 RepID=A0ABQ3VPL5_9CHLR|nr:hypothetical protein KSZ_62030 [Dictyobacter formicarum]